MSRKQMSRKQNIDRILKNWGYDPDNVNVRVVHGDDGRELIQMRIDMGLLQMEVQGRPDGGQPDGYPTYYDCLLAHEVLEADFTLDEDQCLEVDREFVQFYHRRVCWLALKEFDRAASDASHTLAMMDFCLTHSPDDQWTMSHEQYRPFVMFHRIQASALARLEAGSAEDAIQEINTGLNDLHELFEEHEVGEAFEDNELIAKLIELRESLRDHYRVGRTLQEQLADAVAREEYELAAEIRDKLARRETPFGH
jgi:hypothetical protein